MNNDTFTCKYTSGIDSKAIRQLLILSIMAAEMRLGQEAQERDGRYRLDEKSHALDIDTSTAFGKSLAHFFRVLMAEMYLEGEYTLSRAVSVTTRRRRP